MLNLDFEGADKYIFSSPTVLMHNLSDVLKSETLNVNGINKLMIDEAIQSILFEENNDYTSITNKGEYHYWNTKRKG